MIRSPRIAQDAHTHSDQYHPLSASVVKSWHHPWSHFSFHIPAISHCTTASGPCGPSSHICPPFFAGHLCFSVKLLSLDLECPISLTYISIDKVSLLAQPGPEFSSLPSAGVTDVGHLPDPSSFSVMGKIQIQLGPSLDNNFLTTPNKISYPQTTSPACTWFGNVLLLYLYTQLGTL